MSSRESRAGVCGSARRRRQSKERDPPNMSDLRIVLLGKSVSENSGVGNFLLGRAAFDSEAPPDVVERVGGRLKDRHVTVINSPQLLQTNISDHQITQTVRECVSLSDPGPHAFIIILQYKDFTEEDMTRVKHVLNKFSDEAIQRTILITTDEETDKGVSVKANELIQPFTAECGGGHLQLDNEIKRLISGILQRLEKIFRENNGDFLTCDLNYDAEETLVDEDLSRSSASFRTEEDSDGGVSDTRQQKMNLMLCGSNETLKNSVSKRMREKKDVELHGRQISLVELPSLFNTRLSEEEVMRKTLRCVSLCHPGVHVFLLIIPDGPLTDEDKAEIVEIQRIFSSRINKHMMILIMQNSEHQTEELNEETQSVTERFGGQHHFFGLNTQVSTLMENIEKMLEENRGEFFSTETFLEAQMKKLMTYEEMKKKIHSLETHLLPQGSRENTDEVRIVLLGKTGVGKSATGNTILGREVFKAEASFESVTKESQKETSEIDARHVTVIDTPGLFDTELSNEEIQREIRHCISMILPGPHVFIIVLNLGQRFTREEATSVKIIQETFGEKSLMFTMVLFTRGDDLKNKTIEQCLGKPGSALMNLIEACGNRYHVFNNNQTGDRTQVSDLLEKIDNMVTANGGSFYSCKMFRQMEREKQEQQMKILMDRVREREEEMKKLKEEMKREQEKYKNKIEQLKQEKEKLQIKYVTETERLMNKVENERKKREEYIEREEQYKTQIIEKEREIRDEMRREREEWEKQKQEEKTKREEEDEKRREKIRSKHEAEKKKMMEKVEQMNREKEELMKKLEEENERMKMMIEEERQNDDKERKRREELKREIREQEEYQKEIRDEMRRERETFRQETEEMRQEKEKIKTEKDKLKIRSETEIDRLKNRIENERQNHETERKRREEEFNEREERYKEKEELMKKQEEEIERMKTRIEEERQNHDKERIREEEFKKERKEQEEHQREILMNRMENEKKKREEEFREKEERYKREMEEMKREREEWEKQKLREAKRRAEAEADDQECLRIVLIGRTGSGKSATGNTILGRKEFQSRWDIVTTICQKRVGEIDGRSVAVVDTPGLFDTTLTNEHVVEEIMKCISLSSPGPHVFVIVLSVGRFTKEETDTVDLIKKIFGPKAAQFSIVLFTRGDDLEGESIEDFVKRSNNADLKKLIRDCGNRFLSFNNKEKQDKTQVIQLLNMIEELKNDNEGRYFTNCIFEEAEMSIKKRMEEILKEREREIQNQKEELQEKYEREMKDMMKRLEEEKQRADEERKKMENQLREKEKNLRKEFEEKENAEQKKREIENQKRSEEEKQQRAEYHQKIEEMKKEIENQRSQYEKQQKEREEEDRKKEEKYRQDQEKMKNENEQIIAELQMKQEETKKRESEEERQRWERKIKEAENDRKETQEDIKRQQREWGDEKIRKTREREEEERKRKERHEEQLREKQEELKKMRKRFEREREEERQKIEEERQKQRREREEKEREYEEKRYEIKRHYEQLEQERKKEWERRKREDEERREEERNRWKKTIEELKQEQEEEIKRRETEEKKRKEREEKERNEIKQKYEEEIKVMKKKHEDEARKQAEELNDFIERKEEHIQELKETL